MKILATLLVVACLVVGFIAFPKGGSTPPTDRVDGDLIQTISTGEEVDLESHLGDGWTVVEFHADF